MRQRTNIVIAHRLATVRETDRILVLDHGRIVASGQQDQLLAQGGLYARLAALQFQDVAGPDVAGPLPAATPSRLSGN